MPPGHYIRKFREPIVVIGPSIAYLPLTQNQFALIDADQTSNVEGRNWSAMWNANVKSFYVCGHVSGRQTYLHRHLFGADKSRGWIDHANRNPLDNRLSNLRYATPHNNACNRKGAPNKSGFKGVWRDPTCSNRWGVRIRDKSGVRLDCGRFSSPVDAAQVYLFSAYLLHGEFTC